MNTTTNSINHNGCSVCEKGKENYTKCVLGQENKRLTKCEMGYQIGHIEPNHIVSISWDFFLREEIVSTFNQMFGTEIE